MTSIPSSLTNALRNARVIPFVGAGVSMAVTHKARPDVRLFPSWSELLAAAAARLEDEGRSDYAALVRALLGVNPPRYFQAAEEAKFGLGANWYRFLQAHLDPQRGTAALASLELARAIWRLGSKLVITTNYDHVLEWASPEPFTTREWSIGAPEELVAFMRGETKHHVVWHLHGTISRPQDIILTPDGYSTLYPINAAIKLSHEAALHALRSHLLTHTLLFIGFSFSDDHFGSQLKWVADTFVGAAGPHYVVVRRADADATRQRLSGLPIELVLVDDFGAPTLSVLEQLGEVCRQGTGDNVTQAPRFRLRFVKGPHSDHVVDIFEGQTLTLGRSRDATVRLDRDDRVSSFHATLLCGENGLLIADGGASNGTYVNGATVRKQQLKSGDEVVVGGSRFVVEAHQDELGSGTADDSQESLPATVRTRGLPMPGDSE